ncbi:hypothetical protein BGZ50_008999 [Haplosporangium sp. Z 11]|nr:hypothetical protein BGZ50_008999 [Haplosporangium sp. Z 11]
MSDPATPRFSSDAQALFFYLGKVFDTLSKMSAQQLGEIRTPEGTMDTEGSPPSTEQKQQRQASQDSVDPPSPSAVPGSSGMNPPFKDDSTIFDAPTSSQFATLPVEHSPNNPADGTLAEATSSREFNHKSTHEFPNGNVDFTIIVDESESTIRVRSIGWAMVVYGRNVSADGSRKTYFRSCLGVYKCPDCDFVERPRVPLTGAKKSALPRPPRMRSLMFGQTREHPVQHFLAVLHSMPYKTKQEFLASLLKMTCGFAEAEHTGFESALRSHYKIADEEETPMEKVYRYCEVHFLNLLNQAALIGEAMPITKQMEFKQGVRRLLVEQDVAAFDSHVEQLKLDYPKALRWVDYIYIHAGLDTYFLSCLRMKATLG